ncbi:MAG TPA: hypothetical protein VLZ31_07400 [Microbacteriaceae bacterium]|nr:hypothetical protein [Microbacteriaceae bacterium]
MKILLRRGFAFLALSLSLLVGFSMPLTESVSALAAPIASKDGVSDVITEASVISNRFPTQQHRLDNSVLSDDEGTVLGDVEDESDPSDADALDPAPVSPAPLEPELVEPPLFEDLPVLDDSISDDASDGISESENDEQSDDGAETDMDAESAPSKAQSGPEVQRIVPSENFCRHNTYFSLDRISGTRTSTGSLRIRQVTYNPSTFAITPATVAIPSGTSNITLPANGSVNSLGVTEDGIFYFTAQRQYTTGFWPVARTVQAYDVYKYELNSYNHGNSTSAGTLTRVVTEGANASDATLVAGAVDPITGDFFFGFYEAGTGTNGRVQLHLYRHAKGTNTANKVGVFRTATGQNYNESAGNGDFAFNGDGDLIFIASGTANAMTGTVTSAQLQTAISNSNPTTLYNIPTSQISIHNGTVGGTAFNGIAFTSGGQLIVEQGNQNRIKRGIDFSNLTGSATSLTGTVGTLVDLASCHTPPVFKLQKDVQGRYNPNDQFTLEAQWHQTETSAKTSLGTVTTTGAADGIQAEVVGPKPVESGIWYTVAETAGNSGTNLNNYEKTLSCDFNGTNVPVTPTTAGSQTSFRFQYPAVTSTQGGSLTCTFKNSELKPRLETAKSSDPISGTAVENNEVINYTLKFDNSTGTAPATVDHTDWLADVLDDAYFVDAAGNQVLAPVITSSAGLTADWDASNQRINITGTVPTQQDSTLTFKVKVKENSADREASGDPLQGYLLRNYLTPSSVTTPPATCDDTTNMCTEHPVEAWTFEKTSLPVSGASLHKGGNAHYKLAATKMNSAADIEELTFTDDLTQVFKSAGWAPNAAVPGGALPRGVYFFNEQGDTLDQSGNLTATQPAPAYDANEVAPPTLQSGSWILQKTVNMPANAIRAELWFAVQAGETPEGIPAVLGIQDGDPQQPISQPSSGWAFVNYATASAKKTNNAPFIANQCDTATGTADGWWLPDTSADPRLGLDAADASVPAACQVAHKLDANYFTIRKDAAGVGENLDRNSTYGTDTTGLWNMVGHEFEIRDNENGQPSSNQSKYLCRTEYNPGPANGPSNWNGIFITGGTLDAGINSPTLAAIKAWNNENPLNEIPECAIAYPQAGPGGQTGRWKIENLPEADRDFPNTTNATATGDYWLIETKAPTHQISLDGLTTRPVPGTQLLADPVPFKIWPLADGGLWPPVGGQSINEQSRSGRGQLDIASSGDFGAAESNNYTERCLPGGTVGSRPAACVNPTGYLMIVKDSVPMKLPLSGGFGTEAYLLGGSLALTMAFTAAFMWRRTHTPAPVRGRYAASAANVTRGSHKKDE